MLQSPYRSPREHIDNQVKNPAFMFHLAGRFASKVTGHMNSDYPVYTRRILKSSRPTLIVPESEATGSRGRIDEHWSSVGSHR